MTEDAKFGLWIVIGLATIIFWYLTDGVLP